MTNLQTSTEESRSTYTESIGDDTESISPFEDEDSVLPSSASETSERSASSAFESKSIDVLRELLKMRPDPSAFIQKKDEIDMFFESMAEITKKLPLLVQSKIKIAVSQLVLNEELTFEQAKQDQLVQYIVLDQGTHRQFQQQQTSEISTGVQNANLDTETPERTENIS